MGKLRPTEEREFKRLGAGVKYDVPAFGAFGSGGSVARVVCPRDGYCFAKAVKYLKGGKYVVLGGATNVLFPDGGYDGTVLSTLGAKDVIKKGDRIYCSAGARLPDVVSKCRKWALSGLEQLSGIPGSIGGAVAMNAGAFGREIAELLTRVDAVTADGEVVALSPSALRPGYRHTDVAVMGLTVIGAELSLVPSSQREIRECIEGFAARRRAGQPQGRSLGSVFKRADGVSAGYYIERAGLKGAKRGGAEISAKHANFIVNTGGATGEDFIYLSELARKEVLTRFGVPLEYEVVFL